MITAVEIKQKAERKYLDYLRSIVCGLDYEPIEIACDKKASNTLEMCQKELKDIQSLSKEIKGYGYTIEWKTVKTKKLGEQDLPDRILFESASDYECFLQKVGEVAQFRKDVLFITQQYPVLKSWVEKNPKKVVENASNWPDILKVLNFFSSNPRPQRYVRELPIEVHTKFIENNKAIIKDLLDIVIAEYVYNEEKDFEKRYGLLYDEPLVRMRILDTSLAASIFSGVEDISMPVSQFCELSFIVANVFVVENKVNFLTFPSIADSIVIWGHGYGVTSIKDSKLLKQAKLYYWGDIDVQGFEILSQFRGYYPQANSLMMDRCTFDKYFERDFGTPSKVSIELRLTNQEVSLYEYIKSNNYRLEQEKIPQQYVVEQLQTQGIK